MRRYQPGRKAHGGSASRSTTVLAAMVLVAGLNFACETIRMEDIEAPRPVPRQACIVVGFLGGRDRWNDERKGVRQLALRLRDYDRHVYAETFENRRRHVAEEFVVAALDRNGDRAIDGDESGQVTLVVYGQSFGGAATPKFARQLEKIGVPIELTVQIDSVGLGDEEIPPNVRNAANLYQDDGWVIEGAHPIRAADPSRTQVLGNWKFDYSRPPGADISLSGVPWWKTVFRVAHAKMDRDGRTWALAEALVVAACEGEDLEAVGR